MPGTVTVMRGNPLELRWALLLTAAGAVPIVLGLVLPIEDVLPSNRALDVVLWTVGAIVAIPGWLLAWAVVRRARKARREPIGPVPDELAEPPSDDHPAQVAVLVGDGRPSRRAVAGTVLALAARGALEIEEYGERIVVRLQPDAQPANEYERLVLDGLRESVDPSGEVVGPPIWTERVPWWRPFARDARNGAIAAGLVDPSMPLGALIIVISFTAVGVSIGLFNVFVFVGLVPFLIGLTHAMANVGGYRLTHAGRELRARWAAYARYLAAQGSVRDIGPSGVTIWGMHVAYAAVLGQAETAARPLTPGATEEDVPTPFETIARYG